MVYFYDRRKIVKVLFSKQSQYTNEYRTIYGQELALDNVNVSCRVCYE